MANWSGFTLTNQGQALQAKINAGQARLQISRLGLGSGTASNTSTLTGLVKEEQSIQIGSITTENNKVIIKTTLNNKTVTKAYQQREMGLFANDPNVGEVLYAYMIDNTPDTMPAYNSSTVVAEAFTLNLLFSNTGNVSATLDMSLYATLEDLHDHDTSSSAHSNIIMTAAKDTNTNDNSGKIASTSWVKRAMNKFTDFTVSQIKDFESSVKSLFNTDEFYDSVIEALRERTLSALGVKYNFNNANAWSISFGVLFGGLIVQGGFVTYTNTPNAQAINPPLKFKTYLWGGIHDIGITWATGGTYGAIDYNDGVLSFRPLYSGNPQDAAKNGVNMRYILFTLA